MMAATWSLTKLAPVRTVALLAAAAVLAGQVAAEAAVTTAAIAGKH
jgi:hypothetical protein